MRSRSKIKEDKIKQVIKDYLNGLSCMNIAKKYGVSDATIRLRLIENEIALRPSRSFGSTRSTLSNQDILNLYRSGETLDEIAKKAGVKEQAIYKKLKRMGVKFPRVYKSPKTVLRKYNLNEDYFNNKSDEMYYILAIIFTDGNMNQTKNSFSISQKEKTLLEKIAKCLGMPEKCVKEEQVNRRSYYKLTVNSVKMCRSLCWHGVIPNKSKKIEFPNVPKRYLGSFLRGIIDGDGTVHIKGYNVVVYTGSENFAEGLDRVFHELNFKSRRHIDKRGLFRITVSRKINVRRLGKIIYENKGDLYLRRKYFRFNLA